jgi:hypothetical protein
MGVKAALLNLSTRIVSFQFPITIARQAVCHGADGLIHEAIMKAPWQTQRWEWQSSLPFGEPCVIQLTSTPWTCSMLEGFRERSRAVCRVENGGCGIVAAVVEREKRGRNG